MDLLKKLFVKELRRVADDIESGNCVLSGEQMEDVIDSITHRPVYKTEAAEIMHMSRSTFDLNVQLGLIPKGRKQKNKNDLVWFVDELKRCSRERKESLKR